MLSTHSATNSPAIIEAMNTESSTSSSSLNNTTSTLPNIAITSRLSPRKRNMFHLRRHMKDVRYTRDMEVRMYNLFKQYSPYPPKSIPENDLAYSLAKDQLLFRATTILLDKVTRFGRNPEVVDVVLHSDQQGQMVSRLHAEITAEADPEDPTKFLRYSIADRSLNGTYVNDRRAPTVSGELYLKKGDVIKFGHVNGASYKPGEYAIGNESEFIFTFEPAYEGMEYIGHTPDGNRIERKGPQAYIHLGAHSLLPHEFDLFSLVPKREADLSVIPYGQRINPEQKRVEYIQPHSQLVTKSNSSTSSDQSIIPPPSTITTTNSTIHPGTFGATSIPIPGVSNPAIIPNMTNFNLLTDLGRISGELQQQQQTSLTPALNNSTTNTNNEMLLNIISQYFKTFPQPSSELLCLLQLLQIPQQQTQPNLSYFQQPITSANAIHNINIALHGNLLRNYIQPSPNESMITALRQITTPYLNGHTSLNTVNGINSGSGANVVQALYAALQPPTTTAASGVSAASMASLMAAASAAAVSAANSIPTTSTAAFPTTIPTTLPSSHQHQFTPPDPRQVIEDKRKPQSSPDNIPSASSTTSEETTVPSTTRNPALDLLYHDSVITPKRLFTNHQHQQKHTDSKQPEKISINEKMLANVAKAAAAAAVGAHYRNSGETSSDRKSDHQTSVETTPSTPVAPASTTLSRKQRKAAQIADIADHIQETIDFVAKNTTEISVSSDGEFSIELQQNTSLNDSFGKQQRKRKKRSSENENGKHKENVLKILDAVAKMEEPDNSVNVKPKPPTFKIELHDSEPSSVNNGTDREIDREQSSSGGSMIICEATPDDPGLLNGSNIDLLESKKPEELKLLSRRLSGGSKVGSKGRKKKSTETESDDSEDDDDDDILSKYKQSSRKQNNNSNGSAASSDTRPRKKSTSVKSRVIRVPRSPIPSYKKGPERLPGHKSNEVARLLYDLEGSYMHVARKGVTKRERKNTGDDKRHDSDEETDEEEDSESRPSSSHIVPSKRKSTERFSDSPAKKSKDSQERENNISDHEKVITVTTTRAVSSDDEEELASPVPKLNGTSESSRKGGKRSKDANDGKHTVAKPPRKNAKKQHVVAEIEEIDDDKHSVKSDASDSEEEEPTPKRRKNGVNGKTKKDTVSKTTPTTLKEKKKPGRQPKKDLLQQQPKKKPGRKAKDKNTFVEITNNEWERCAFPACRHPRVDTTVNWVQCDDCDEWYHIGCVFGRDDKSVLEDEFHCGCSKEPRATPIAVMA